MLDTPTKRRIDDCRDILVGKLPDPKSQIEQITIALIYKFMNDMDRQNQDLGGEAKFFTGDFEKYSWDNLFDSKVTSTEMLNLYMEAIEKMELNPNIPELFRSMFKNAYLPYRDPETLRLFLKTIGKFEYTHSEKLGDAFEYLLSVMGSQGDAGQFRTPRHIIDFIVEVVDPGKEDRILDPACGTAGFLISAYNHIRKKNNNEFSPDEKKRLIENSVGYDISPDMVRLSLVNLYLHQFSDPHIYEYDTLSSEERWNENFDVILANPPFMSPKGGIKPHKKFSIQSNRAEVLFVDYIVDHLTPNGKAGVIVPEGIIFQSNNAYTSLRKKLVSEALWAVVSLPSGVFNPYSGVKTSILLMDKELAKKSDAILFIKIENDGYGLGAQRNEQKGSEIPLATKKLSDFKKSIKSDYEFKSSSLANRVLKTRIEDSGDFNLSGGRYEAEMQSLSDYETVSLANGELFEIVSGGTPKTKIDKYWNGEINWATLVDLPDDDLISTITSTERKITDEGLKNSSAKLLPKHSIIVSTRATIGRIAINEVPCATNQGFKNIVIKDKDKVDYRFVALMMTHLVERMTLLATGGTFKELSKTNFKKLSIPYPPIEKQEEIVNEVNNYQQKIEEFEKEILEQKSKISAAIMKVWGEECDEGE